MSYLFMQYTILISQKLDYHFKEKDSQITWKPVGSDRYLNFWSYCKSTIKINIKDKTFIFVDYRRFENPPV